MKLRSKAKIRAIAKAFAETYCTDVVRETITSEFEELNTKYLSLNEESLAGLQESISDQAYYNSIKLRRKEIRSQLDHLIMKANRVRLDLWRLQVAEERRLHKINEAKLKYLNSQL